MGAFQATIDGRFAPLATLADEDADLDSMVTHFNKTVTDTAAELPGKQRRKRKLWLRLRSLIFVTKDDIWRKREMSQKEPKTIERLKQRSGQRWRWQKRLGYGQCQEVEVYLRKNNSKKAYQLVKDLTKEKQGKFTTIQDKSQENEILNRWTEYCSDLYNYETDGEPTVFDCPQIPDEEHHSILWEEVEAAVKALETGKSAENYQPYQPS